MAPPVTKRHVLLIPGFDPTPARSHRERYRRELARQNDISGHEIEMITTPGVSDHWQMRAGDMRSEFQVLQWSDLVEEAMGGRWFSNLWHMVCILWVYLGSGAFFRLAGLRKGPVIAALYPGLGLLAQLALAVLVWVLAVEVIFGATRAVMIWIEGPRLFPSHILPHGTLCFLLALIPVFYLLRWFKRIDGRLLIHYLIQDYAYAARAGGAYDPQLSDRLAAFSQEVTKAAQGDVDEVLLIGHSSGAYLAITVLADALRSGALPEGPHISLLTLGQVVPMVSILPRADRLRADLAFLSTSDRITWVDVTAPGDGCAFALCDPVAVSGVGRQDQRWPLVISAAFSQTLSRETLKRLRWRFFRLHFQYMCAFDRPGDYDFFAVTAGSQSLGDRFAGRSHSPGRITRALRRPRGRGL